MQKCPETVSWGTTDSTTKGDEIIPEKRKQETNLNNQKMIHNYCVYEEAINNNKLN
jgi:hypothetical protein